MLAVSGSARRTCVAKEEGVAVVITNEEIEIAVTVDIGQSRAGVSTNIRNSKGSVLALLAVSGSRCAHKAACGPGGFDDQISIGPKGAVFCWSSKGEDGSIASGIVDGAAVELESC